MQARDLVDLSQPSSSFIWPNVHPCAKDITGWKACLWCITSTNYRIPFNLQLGKWILPPHLKWQWFFWQCQRQLFHQVNDVWHHYVPFFAWSTVTFKWIGIVAALPIPVEELQRATVHFDQGWVLFKGLETNEYPAPPTNASIYDFIADWEDFWPLEDSFLHKTQHWWVRQSTMAWQPWLVMAHTSCFCQQRCSHLDPWMLHNGCCLLWRMWHLRNSTGSECLPFGSARMSHQSSWPSGLFNFSQSTRRRSCLRLVQQWCRQVSTRPQKDTQMSQHGTNIQIWFVW